MAKISSLPIALVAAGLLALGCTYAPTSPVPEQDMTSELSLDRLLSEAVPAATDPAPGPLVTVQAQGKSLNFWPYTGANVSGQPQDPINLIFFGKADPCDIRAALLALDGDRTALGFPAAPPFNATWDDAIGDVQTGYSEGGGWTGGAIQLACGDYGPVRFHLRLFRMGDWTVGNAHFELLIPGTTDHQVLSWEVAEQFVVTDFLRSGLLDPSAPVIPSGGINQPNFREIPAQIYNLLPVELRGLIGGPLGEVTSGVPIGSDGVAAVLNLAGGVPWKAEQRAQSMTISFDQTVPKPFCSSGPYDYVYVSGDVTLTQTTILTPAGSFEMTFRAEGALQVQPVDPLTGQPIGVPMTASVREHHSAQVSHQATVAASWVYQRLSPVTDPAAGFIFRRLVVADPGTTCFREMETCAKQALATIR
jgi:hypothetical protein